jgi:hypothetical protein
METIDTVSLTTHAPTLELATSRLTTPAKALSPWPGFHGRAAQLAQLDERFTTGSVPIAAVVGQPGVGKTWLVHQWLATREIPAIWIDANQFTPNSPDGVAHATLDELAAYFEWPGDEQVIQSVEDLAFLMRRAETVFVIDSAEHLLHTGTTGRDVGRPADRFSGLLRAFRAIRSGPGRVILTSRVRPGEVTESEQVRHMQLVLVSSDGRDPTQLGGLAPPDGLSLLKEELRWAGFPSESWLTGVVKRFDGHPYALRWFSQLSESEQQALGQPDRSSDSLYTKLHDLLHRLIAQCSDLQLRVLRVLVALRQPASAGFVAQAAALDDIDQARALLDALHRRSLVEYGLYGRSGYSVHAIVREWASLRFSSALIGSHASIAAAYASRTSDNPVDAEYAREAAYHYEKANSLQESRKYRDMYARQTFTTEREFYYEGEYELAISEAGRFIEAYSDLLQDDLSRKTLAKAHYHRAKAIHRFTFDWESETSDLRVALQFWPANSRILSFYRDLVSVATSRQVPWRMIETELAFALEKGDRAVDFSTHLSRPTLLSTLLELASFWIDHSPSPEQRRRLHLKLESYLSRLDSPSSGLSDSSVYLSRVRALIKIANHVDERTASVDYSLQAIDLADEACDVSRHSEQLSHINDLLLERARACLALSRFEAVRESRMGWLRECIKGLASLEKSVPVPRGFARTYADATIQLSHLLLAASDIGGAVTAIEAAYVHLTQLQRNTSAYNLDPAEMVVAVAGLLLAAGKLEPDKEALYVERALDLIRPLLYDPAKIDPQIAERAIDAFTAHARLLYSRHDEPADDQPGDIRRGGTAGQTDTSGRVVRLELHRLERAITSAKQVRPSPRYDILRLRLYLEYLRMGWQPDNAGPRREVDQAKQLAQEVYEQQTENYSALSTVAEFWHYVARRAWTEAEFSEALARGNEVFERLRPLSRNKSNFAFEYARFLRDVQDYQAVRDLLRPFIQMPEEVRQPHMHTMFLDAVAHSLNASMPDAHLVHDAALADTAYRQFLDYLGVAEEDISITEAAKRYLWWWRCRVSCDPVAASSFDPSWIDDVYDEVDFSIGVIAHFEVLPELKWRADPLARVLGHDFANGSIWREVGTFLLSAFGSDERMIERVVRFWKISMWWMGNRKFSDFGDRPYWEIYRGGKGAEKLTRLNLARALLSYRPDSEEYRNGLCELAALAKPQSFSWTRFRYVKELCEKHGVSIDP